MITQKISHKEGIHMKEFVVATPGDVVEFNELFRNVTGSAGYIAANNIFSRLVTAETIGDAVYPDLAHHWEILDGAQRYRFYLNPQARWHDGVPLTSADVEYSHKEALSNGYNGAGYLVGVVSINVIDDHTIDYILDEPNSGFLTQLGSFVFTHIIPKHLYEGTDWASNPHNLAPVGSGPFRLERSLPGDHIELSAVPDYWGPPPGVDRITIRIMPDRDEALQEVLAGRVHYVTQDVLTRPTVPLVEGVEGLRVIRETGIGVSMLGFNYTQERFQDRRVREAIARAIDRDELTSKLGDPGWSGATDVWLPESVQWAFNPDAKAPGFDPERARALLDEAGFTADADGVRMTLRMYHLAVFPGHRGLGLLIAEQFAKVGIVMTVEALGSADWFSQIQEKADFDLTISAGNMVPDPQVTAPKFETGGQRNHNRYSNAEVDRHYREARSVVARSVRGEHYRQLQTEIANDVGFVPLWAGCLYSVASEKFFGLSSQLEGRVPYWHWGRVRPSDEGGNARKEKS